MKSKMAHAMRQLRHLPRFLALFLPLLCILSLVSAPYASARNSQVAVLSYDKLDPALAAAIKSAPGPTIIEFLDARDTGPECVNQSAAYASAEKHFAGRVTFLSADVADQDPTMMSQARIAVCPTLLYVFDKQADHFVARRFWGYKDRTQVEEIIKEVYGIDPQP